MPVMVRCVSMKVSNNAYGVMALTMLGEAARQTTTAAPMEAARMRRQEKGGRGRKEKGKRRRRGKSIAD